MTPGSAHAHQNKTTWKFLSRYLGHVNNTDEKSLHYEFTAM